MSLRRILAPTALAVLALATAAPAKEIAKVQACGPHGCRTVTRAMHDESALLGGATVADPKRAPFYRLRVFIRGDAGGSGPSLTLIYMRSRGMVRDERRLWHRLPRRDAKRLSRAVRGLAPFSG